MQQGSVTCHDSGGLKNRIDADSQAMRLCGEARDIEAMRDAQPKPGYRRLKEIIDARANSLIRRVREFLPQGEIVKANTMVSRALRGRPSG
jgi:hypothetical protein